MEITLYNTLKRQQEIFQPISPKQVGLYTCGPTVYNYAHVGNLRTYIFEDVLKRILTYNHYQVKHVMNITDVGHLTSDGDEGEDKMEKGSRREKKSAWEIAEFYTQAFLKDLAHLNCLPANLMPKATDHIPEQIALIEILEKKGFTYKTTDGIYFDTTKLSDYGKLAQLDKHGLMAGARVELGEKKNPTDFALWKFSSPKEKRQMEWNSPWGTGFPGWHIECSAMATKYLGQPFDLHCGGIDHVTVHHTNEIAQSEAAYERPLANYWLHGEFLLIGSDKMAKSGENFITLQTIIDRKVSPIAYRYFTMQAHYRRQLNFSWEALEAAQNGLMHLYESVVSLPATISNTSEIKQRFNECINNDLDLPSALSLLWTAIKDKTIDQATTLEFDEVLGLKIKESIASTAEPIPETILTIVKERESARTNGDWAKSDTLRKKIEDLGYTIKDTKEGTKIKKI